jgi:hypothetical protein
MDKTVSQWRFEGDANTAGHSAGVVTEGGGVLQDEYTLKPDDAPWWAIMVDHQDEEGYNIT